MDLIRPSLVSSAVNLLDDEQLVGLLLDARATNQRESVTGVLLHSDGNFIQCIEGAKASVRRVFERIGASSQHRGIVTFLSKPIAARSFADWRMGCAEAAPSDLLSLAGANWHHAMAETAGVEQISQGMLLLKTFWKHARR